MIYLYGYLGVGAIILMVIARLHRLRAKEDKDPLDEALTNFASKQNLWSRLTDVFFTIFAGLLILPFWPVILFFKVKESIFGVPEPVSFEDPKFAVSQDDLLVRISVREIEDSEKVEDPLGAVPSLPFGHLNAAWKQFLAGVEPSDEIWRFKGQWRRWSRIEVREGYVIVREDGIGDYFMTAWHDLKEELSPTEKAKSSFGLMSFFRKQTA